jgi:ribosome maturation factor RimP
VYRDIPEELRALIEPVIEDAGFELVDVLLTRGRQPWLLRITIDNPSGDGLVAVDRCADVSREIETHLDTADAMSAPYRLEVSSPGLDRVLSREKDFAPACGSEVRIETRAPLDGRRRFRGRLLTFADGVATLDLDGREVRIPLDAIAKAHTIYQFTRDDFASRVGIR